MYTTCVSKSGGNNSRALLNSHFFPALSATRGPFVLQTHHSSCPYPVLVEKNCKVSTIVINVTAGLEVKDKFSGQLKSSIFFPTLPLKSKSKRTFLLYSKAEVLNLYLLKHSSEPNNLFNYKNFTYIETVMLNIF